MSEQENLKVAEADYEGFNAHDLNTFSKLRSVDFMGEGTGVDKPMNLDQYRIFLQGYLTAFPDAHIDVNLMIAQGNYVVTRWTGTGTHTRPFHTPTGGSIPATGKKLTLKGCDIYELKDGKIIRPWKYFDRISLLAQLGLLPPM